MNHNTTAFFDGKFASMQLFDFAPSGAQFIAIQGGLNSRFGLNL